MKKEENYTSVRRIRFRKSAANINEALRNMRITMCKKRNLKQEGMDDNVAKVLAVDALLTEENMARTINRLNLIGLKQLMKVCKEKKKEEQAMGMSVLGLDVRRIEGNPSYRKESHSKCQGEQRKASTMERDGEIIRSHRSAIEENTIPEDSQRKYSCVGRRD